MTQRVFCEAEGISVATLHNWLRAFREREAFTEVATVASRQVATLVEVVFPDGTTLRLRGE